MKTFRELISEAKHHGGKYSGKWGIIRKDGKLVDGESHPTAKTHADLGDGYVTYLQSHYERGALHVRTDGQTGIGLAIKHWPSLPHVRSGMVYLDHYDGNNNIPESSEGKSHEVLSHLKSLQTNNG